jgi:hypothetical protein
LIKYMGALSLSLSLSGSALLSRAALLSGEEVGRVVRLVRANGVAIIARGLDADGYQFVRANAIYATVSFVNHRHAGR